MAPIKHKPSHLGDRQAQLHLILYRGMLKRILLRHLGRSGRIDLVGHRTRCIAGRAGQVKPQNGQKPVRSERTKKPALMALAIVDELTADGAMHLLFGIRKITDGNGWAVLAEAVGENSIVEDRSSQVDNRSFGCVQGTNALDVNGLILSYFEPLPGYRRRARLSSRAGDKSGLADRLIPSR